jgi:hypothetical protein
MKRAALIGALALAIAAVLPLPLPREARAAVFSAGHRPAYPAPLSIESAYRIALDTTPARRVSSEAVETTMEGAAAAEPRLKSPTKAMILSALVPGLGQFYSGHPGIGVAYLGIEAAGWTTYSVLRSNGFDKREESRDFADDHYDSTVYNDKKDEDPIALPNRELPYNDDVEYYEDIAKLNELIWGWDDHVPAIDQSNGQQIPGASANREIYQDMRHDANGDIKTARNISIGIFVNHIVSAFHAFKLVQWYNQNVNRELSGYKIKIKQTRDKEGLMCVVSKKF